MISPHILLGLFHGSCIIMTKIENVSGRYWRDDARPDTIYVTLEHQEEVLTRGIDYGEIHEAIYRWFVDQAGFPSETLVVSDDTKNHSLRLVAKVQFVDDGVVMAKLQGILH